MTSSTTRTMAWRAAHREEWRAYQREYRRQQTRLRRPHQCPGTDGRGCLTVIPGDRLHCHFCTRTLIGGTP